MKITAISAQVKDKNRVNIMVDGVYRFSLDIFQVGELGIRVGKEYTDEELSALETESIFGKLYSRTLQFCMMRLHSAKEIQDYLWKKTRDTRTKTGEVRKGVSAEVTSRVFARLTEKGYVNDELFARHWVENRHMSKGASARKLIAELRSKGIEQSIIEKVMRETTRDDSDELMKMIAKKRQKYTDEQKLIQYLARQGFAFDDIKAALADI
ncbi:MAG TPA: RecX family transcriptional regulator [Candidatus Saccharimonadales bacterium]|nr:RecX family transcriptional regulator [Candidatus Saccharimonadales bacterium]